MSRKKQRVFKRKRKLSRSRSRRIHKKSVKIKHVIKYKKKKRLLRKKLVVKRKKRVVKKKKRVLTRKPTRKVIRLVRRKDKQKLAPKKKRRQIIKVTERRKFSTRLDFTKKATEYQKLSYLIKKVKDGMILRFVIKAPKGKGSPTKRAKKTGRVTRRSPYISTGWINFGTLSPERIEFYLNQLGGIDRIERIFYMPKR